MSGGAPITVTLCLMVPLAALLSWAIAKVGLPCRHHWKNYSTAPRYKPGTKEIDADYLLAWICASHTYRRRCVRCGADEGIGPPDLDGGLR